MAADTLQSIYTDGACSGNPGPGGWGAVAYFSDGSVHEMGGAAAQTTNNRMEIQGAIAALEFILQSDQTEPLILYTDSEYVINGITKWVQGWKKKSWKTAAGKPVLNQDLWTTLDRLNSQVSKQLTQPLQWKYVRGHTGNEGNERCDAIARSFSLGRVPKLITQSPALAAPTNLQQNIKSDPQETDSNVSEEIQSSRVSVDSATLESAMVDSTTFTPPDGSDVPREVRVVQLRNMVETLRMADEVASQGYLITSAELADLMDVNASAVTSRGDNWVWRNWVVSRVRREGNQILWQLERVD